jgi:hypothetical protein
MAPWTPRTAVPLTRRRSGGGWAPIVLACLRRARRSSGRLALLLCVVALIALVPAPALAGTASVSGGTLSYDAAPGEINNVSMGLGFFGSSGHGVRELGGALVVAGAGCVQVTTQSAWCGATPTAMDVELDDGDDQLFSNDLGGVAHGGAGTMPSP